MVSLLRDRPYVMFFPASFLSGWGIFMLFFYVQLLSSSLGLSETLTFYTVAIVNAASVLGRIVPNMLADKWGPITCLIPTSVICSILIFALCGVKSSGGIIVICILYGFFSGGFFSLISPLLAEMADHPTEIGVRIGISFAIVGVAALTGNPINGALIGSGPDYVWWKAFVFSGVCLLAGTVLTGYVWVLVGKKKGKLWV